MRGSPTTISWDILKNHVKVFISLPDWAAAQGMRMLAAPIKGDAPITSGESGGRALRRSGRHHDYEGNMQTSKQPSGLNETSRVLVFSTEGDTDPERYKNIVWKGLEK